MSSPGLSAYQVAVLKGFRGSETEWLSSLQGREGRSIKGDKGDKGDSVSAYEVARANGFTGTQAAWLDSLKGRPGLKGDKGDRGERGIDAVLPQKPKKWIGEVFRDDRDRLQGALLKSDTGLQWQAAFSRDSVTDQIDEIVLVAS